MKFKTRNQIEREKILSVIQASSTPKKTADDEFRNACDEFREACAKIREFFQLEEFYGSFQECRSLVRNPKYTEGDMAVIKLHLLLETTFNTAVFEGNELNLSGSDWWYKCWEYDGIRDSYLKEYLKKYDKNNIHYIP